MIIAGITVTGMTIIFKNRPPINPKSVGNLPDTGIP
jgi:hypothetical protein